MIQNYTFVRIPSVCTRRKVAFLEITIMNYTCIACFIKRFRTVYAVLLASLLLMMLTSCNDNGGVNFPDITDTDEVSTEEETTEAVTEYVPEMDEDADRLDGIAIKSAEDLAKIGVDKNYPLNGDYVLVIDIDLSGFDSWTPIGRTPDSGAFSGEGVFTGTFDGRNHTISGLCIEETINENSFWGLFGTVGSRNKNDPAVIKNIVLKGVKIKLSSTAATGVGSLAGQVNGYAEISSISLLSGSVEFSGSGSLGVGGLIGQCRTQKTGSISNNGVTVENIFSNVTVTAENAAWDTCGGIIGRIRDSELGSLRYVVLIADVLFEGNKGCAIASGDNGAKIRDALYFYSRCGKSRDGIGESVSLEQLTNASLSLSGLWTVQSGFYPLITDVMESPSFTIMDLSTIRFYQNETIDKVKNNFTLPSSVAGISISWTSDNPDVIDVSGGTAKVKQPEEGFVDVKLTAVSGAYTEIYTVRVVSSKTGYFVTDYIVAGEPIEVAGYPEDATFKWIITDMTTGTSQIKRTDKPSLTLTEADVESYITVQCDGYDDISMYYSYLPIIYMTSDKKYAAVPAGQYVDVEMKICASDEYSSDLLYSGDAEIRLRGNSTARLAKKPFKVKLETKTNLLGIDEEGANKHWCLMANGLDPTLMRNILLQDFSSAIGTEVYMGSESVVLIYNGEYKGVYQLTEHVRVDETRVDVFDWQEYAEEAGETIAETKHLAGEIGFAEETKLAEGITAEMLKDWSWMSTGEIKYKRDTYVFTEWGLPELPEQTGGFLLEMDFYSQGDASLMRTETAYKQPLYFNTPEPTGHGFDSFMETPLYEYTYKYIQSFEYAIHSDDFYFRNSDPQYVADVHNRWSWSYREADYTDDVNDGLHYSEMFDMDSLVNNFIFCEIAMNWDSMKNSFFVYKDVLGLAKIGPQWDFDWAWGNVLWNGNTWRPEEWHCRCTDFMIEQYYQEEQWNCLLIRDPYFLTKVWERWNELRDEEIDDLLGDGGIMDSYIDYLRTAASANDKEWAHKVSYGYTFESETQRMKEFIAIRLDWMDAQFASLEKLIDSLGVYHASELIEIENVSVRSNETTVTISVSDVNIESVTVQLNGTTMIDAAVSGGKATVKISSDLIDTNGYNCVTVFARDSSGEYIVDADHSDTGNYNCIVSNYYAFSIN